MNTIIYGDVVRAPFYKTTGNEELSQCTPENPFGVKHRPSSELRSMEGVHYTHDPIKKKIRDLRVIQNTHNAVISAAVVADIAAKVKAIEFVMWASTIIKAAMDNIMDDASDEKEKLYYEKAPVPLTHTNSGTSERIGRYNGRQDIKANNTTEANDTAKSDADG